ALTPRCGAARILDTSTPEAGPYRPETPRRSEGQDRKRQPRAGLHWQLTRFLALQDAINVRRCAPKIIDQVISIGQQATDCSELTVWIDGREVVARLQRCDLDAMGIREGIRHHDQAAIRRASLVGNNGLELGPVVNWCCDRLYCEGHSGSFEWI